MMAAFWLIVGSAGVWLITSGLIYLGFNVLQFMTIFPDNMVFTFSDALSYGELIALALIAAGVLALILNALHVIDISCLFKKK